MNGVKIMRKVRRFPFHYIGLLVLVFVLVACEKSEEISLHSTELSAENPAEADVVEEEQQGNLISDVDGMELIYVPAGEFTMGTSEAELERLLAENSDWKRDWFMNELPQHTVYLDAYYIDKMEVSQAQYVRCVADGACQPVNWEECWHPEGYDLQPDKFNADDQPVVCVDWNQAQAYCEWAGRRLPSEAEWENAARGTDGRAYPWGDEFDCRKGNFDDGTETNEYMIPGGAGCDGYDRTAPVGSFEAGASPYGALDMAGNVLEWTTDYIETEYYAKSPLSNPQGPSSGELRVIRGGSWDNSSINRFRTADRGASSPSDTIVSLGFRCAASGTEKPNEITSEPVVTATEEPFATPAENQLTKDVSDIDGMELIYIPAGEFLMGTTKAEYDLLKTAEEYFEDELPQHTVYLDAYYIDRTEVSQAQYARCVAAGACQPVNWEWCIHIEDDFQPENFDNDDQPVVCVDWHQATQYCKWAGRRLPSEAEWEKAARGTDGRTYPWGNEFDCRKGNFDDETKIDGYVIQGGTGCDGYERTAPVGSFEEGASPYGALDMAGNVMELTAGWYGEEYYAESPQNNPQGPSSGSYQVLRGSSWITYKLKNTRCATRRKNLPVNTYNFSGFRCAVSEASS
jgi:formylglycine-generating enzyme required for sulfatase activity